MREESRYHYMQHLINISRIKLDRAEQEKQWQSGKGRMIRDFATLKDFYAVRVYDYDYEHEQMVLDGSRTLLQFIEMKSSEGRLEDSILADVFRIC